MQIGDIVHYVIQDGPRQGECRPAIVTRLVYPEDAKAENADIPTATVQVFTDGRDDRIQAGNDGLVRQIGLTGSEDNENLDVDSGHHRAGSIHAIDDCRGAYGADKDEQGRPLEPEKGKGKTLKGKKSAAKEVEIEKTGKKGKDEA
jgi:hypothetical protein